MSYYPRLIQLMSDIKDSQKTRNHFQNINWKLRGSLSRDEQLEVDLQMKKLREQREHTSHKFHT